jgi:NAD(P)H-nitrite reductase large subunit
MLKLGEKGAIPQKDKETYAIAPHIPCGVVTPQLLRNLADVAEKYNVQAMKITGATRIALIGFKEEQIDAVWQDLGMQPGAAVGLCVRSIRACPGNTYCRIGKQDALGMGMRLDKAYHGVNLPNKLKMAVSGCHLNCAESWVRDIGLVGKPEGWMLTIGGNVGPTPRIGRVLVAGLDDDQAVEAIAKIVAYYEQEADKGERLGKMLERVGMEPFQKVVEVGNE